MTAKGHITLQKYCFYVSWQNLDLNFQPCRLQNSNKTNEEYLKIINEINGDIDEKRNNL